MKNMKSKGQAIIISLLAGLAASVAAGCQRDVPGADDGLPPYEVGDWEDGGKLEGDFDNGRPMTHEDSIRFGLLPPDGE